MTDDGLPAAPLGGQTGTEHEKTIEERTARAELSASIRKTRIVRYIILSGWALTLLTMVAIVGTALVMMWHGGTLPDTLGQWGGIALGFLFGTFAKIMNDYVTSDTKEN